MACLALAAILNLVPGPLSLFPDVSIEVGMATYYSYTDYGEQPLYCWGQYDEHTLQATQWVAVDVREYQSGRVRCGDTLLICFDSGCVKAHALDAGPFKGYFIEDYPDLPILVDFPREQWPIVGDMSAVVNILNLSKTERSFSDIIHR